MAVKYAELWSRWRHQGDLRARDKLIELYLWLVRYVAGRLAIGLPPQYDPRDIEGHGCFGLLEAINRYDPERGVRFETVAIPWIRGACLEGIRAMQWAPALRKRVLQLEQAQAELTGRLGREPTHTELAAELQITPEELDQRITEAGCLGVLSLEEVLTDDEGSGTSLAERLRDSTAPDPAEWSQQADRRERLAEAIRSLTEQEQLVVSLFYYEGLMAREISEVMGLSPARISQIHSRAILRLRGKLARSKSALVT